MDCLGQTELSSVQRSSSSTEESTAEEILLNSNASNVYKQFQALYRSSLCCPDCHKQSNTFETYSCLSLPLPQKTLRPVYVTVVYLDEQPKQVRIGFRMNTMDTVKELRENLASMIKISETRIVLCQIFDDGFHCTYRDNQPLTDVPENETIYAIEMFPLSDYSKRNSQYEEIIQAIVLHVEHIVSPSRFYRFCTPYVIEVPRDFTYGELQKEVLRGLGCAVRDGVAEQAKELLCKLRIVDGISGNSHLPVDVEMPLYMQTVDRALSYGKDCGQEHIKLIAEWDTRTKDRIIFNDDDNIEEHNTVHQARLSQQQPISVCLDECFQLFTQEETLSDDDAWLCPHCKKQQLGTTKTIGLWSLPDVLVIHLKRFRQTGLRRNKLNVLVNFPISGLNMSPHILSRHSKSTENGIDPNKMAHLREEEMTFDLFAVCNHYGNMMGGHYTAYCKNPVDQRWYEFDDSKVTEIGEKEIITRSAYLLFYQRRGLADENLEDLVRGQHWVFRMCRNPDKNFTNAHGNRREVNTFDRDHYSNQSLPKRTDIFTTPQQSRRQISSVQPVARQAWSTPQPQRKYNHQMDHDQNLSNFSRQNSIPSKSRPHSGEHSKIERDLYTSLRVDLPPRKPPMTKPLTPNTQSGDSKGHMTSPPSTPISEQNGHKVTITVGSPATIQIKNVAIPPVPNVTSCATKQTSSVTTTTNKSNSNQDTTDSRTFPDPAMPKTPVPSSVVPETRAQKLTSLPVLTSQCSSTNHSVGTSDTPSKSVKEILASSQFGSPRDGRICDSVTSSPVVSQHSFPVGTATSVPVTNGVSKHMATALKEPTAKRSLNQTFQQINHDQQHSHRFLNGTQNKPSKKYATMSRIRDVHHVDQFGDGDRQFIQRSHTDHSITSHTRPGNYALLQVQPQSDHSVSYADSTYSRYQPHHHHYRHHMLNREVEAIHKQEKMFSPILKESSV
ncbi:hypothetical protein ScPMuIL_004303 [Solemya velum]